MGVYTLSVWGGYICYCVYRGGCTDSSVSKFDMCAAADAQIQIKAVCAQIIAPAAGCMSNFVARSNSIDFLCAAQGGYRCAERVSTHI